MPMMSVYSSFSMTTTTTFEKWGIPGLGGTDVGGGTGGEVRTGCVGERSGIGAGVAVAFGVVGAGVALRAAGRAAPGDEDLRATDGFGPAGLGATSETDADGSGSGVARLVGGLVTTARVSVGKGAPQATSSRAQLSVRRARTPQLKPTSESRRLSLRRAVPVSSKL